MTPAPSTKQHGGQRGTITRNIFVVRPMLLRSRILVAKCQLAGASSRGAVARLPEVSLIHKLTASSLASSISLSRCRCNHRARARAKIIKGLKASASFVAALVTKPQSVN